MTSTTLFLMLGVTSLISSVRGHGWMTRPATRAELAARNGLQTGEWCPHCSSLWDVQSGEGLDQYQNRPYPGGRPFAQPGEAAPMLGPCAGKGSNGPNDYNRPGGVNRLWGFEVVDTFAAGDIVTVNWTASANHIGVYSYRICRDQRIVDIFRNPDRTPTVDDYFAAEACFQDGILRCDDPALGNTNCASSASQTRGCRAEWGCANSPAWFGIAERQPWYVDRVRLPTDFSSDHTLLTWRWDVLETQQIYFGCADIRVTAADGAQTTTSQAPQTTTQATTQATTTQATQATTTTQAPQTTTRPPQTTVPLTTVPVGTSPGTAEELAQLRALVLDLTTMVLDLADQIATLTDQVATSCAA